MSEEKEQSNQKKESVHSKKEIEIKLKGQTQKYSISIKTKTTISDLSSVIDEIIPNLEKSRSFSKTNMTEIPTVIPQQNESGLLPPSSTGVENTVEMFALRINVDGDALVNSKLIGIKDQNVQIIKVTQISPFEAAMLILAVKDLLMNEKPLPYEDWKEISEANGIKSKTPFYKLAGNAKDRGYIDKGKHANKEILLTPKGIDFVQKSITKFLN